MLNRASQYESAWNTITSAANSASASVTALSNSCAVRMSAAQTALATEIAPVLARAVTASTTIATARAMVQKIQTELTSTAAGAGGAYSADMQALQSMSPTLTEVTNAQRDAQVFGTATTSPSGSLTASGGSVVDRMNIIGTNAQALKLTCTAPTP